ncbi:Ig-like domain repeat protein [Streptomyces sp. F63]|uniref:Ig-like domain repeat protein n=1 Tax=Streptomyces sp. F63 TaxID=2824887 RepID=UPI001B35C4F3|nr:Ig-like domain repeat protein [Streptomyces sp. F63]MBQ0984210.1 Ig-like domain repeat protein [Streptomyces sp. F63]
MPYSTLTTITASPTTTVYGQPVTFTATVRSLYPPAGTPTGTVTFRIDGPGGGTFTAALDSLGRARVTLSTLDAGTHSITATYNGSPVYLRSQGFFLYGVTRASTATRVSSSPDPSAPGQPVTFTARVEAVPPGAGTPTGEVVFVIGALGAFTARLDANGVARVTVSRLPTGTSGVTAIYKGDHNFLPSSGTGTHSVEPVRYPTTTTVVSAPDPSAVGQPVTITATVTPDPGADCPGPPTGTVTFVVSGDGGGTFVRSVGAGGTATLTLSTLGPGSHDITATYNGDACYLGSAGTDTHTVGQATTTTTVVSAPDPSAFGETVTFTATVTPVPPGSGTPTGHVVFEIDGLTLTGTLVNGVAAVSTDALPIGEYDVTATYPGDPGYAGSQGFDTHTVGRATTTTTVTSSPDPSAYGEPVTFTATVTPVVPGTGTPTGTVRFEITGPSGTIVRTGELDVSGQAVVLLQDLEAEEYTVTAVYQGDATFAGSSGTDTHTVTRAATSTLLVSSPDPSEYGQNVTFEALVSSTVPGGPVPTGTVTLTVGGNTVVLSLDATGTARFTTATLPAGSYTATAAYSGDENHEPSSGTDPHTVDRAPTRTVLTSVPDPSVFGEEVVFRVTVSAVGPGAGVPTGSVTVTDSAGDTFTLELDETGSAEVRTAGLPVGTYSATADYLGDGNFAPSSGSDSHRVDRAGTTLAVTTGPDPSVLGETVTFTATVTPTAPGAGTPAGTVVFLVDGRELAGTLTGGTVTVTDSTLPVGTYTVTAVYAGDASFTGSTGTDTHTVTAADTTTTVTSSPDPSVFGQPVLVTAQVLPVTPTGLVPGGTVTFTVSGGGGTTTVPVDTGGAATFTLHALPAGPHEITAVYSGDASFTGSTGTDTHTVTAADTTTTVTTAPDPSASGTPVTISATVTADPPGSGTPTGTVLFTIDGVPQTPVPLNPDGTAVLVTSSLGLTPDPHLITADYTSDTANFTGSSGSDTHRVVVNPQTATTVGSSPDPSVFGETVTFTATVTPSGPGPVPTGTVTFVVSGGSGGGTFTRPLDGTGTATLTLDTLSVATHAVTATYSGDAVYTEPSSGTDTHVVDRAATLVTAGSAPDPSVFGETVAFTATVVPIAPGAGTPTGEVVFTIDGTVTLTGILSGGTVTVTDATLPAGPHTVIAEYVGDENFTGSTGSDSHQVVRADTTTTVATSPDPSVFGQPVTVTAVVAPVAPGAGTPTGTVTFTPGGGSATTVPLGPDGTATLVLTSLPAGVRTIDAVYSGDPGHNPSAGSDTHTVTAADTTTTVTSSPAPSVFGQPVLFSAAVSPVAPGSGTPTGTVEFQITGPTTTTLTGTLNPGGIAVVSTGTLPTGDYTVTATYSGSPDFTGSTGTDTHTVARALTQTTVLTAPDPSVSGQDVLFEAVVAPIAPGQGIPTGSVTFVDSGGGSVTVPLDANGVARTTTSTLPAGSYLVDAFYGGSADFAPSSGADTHQVDKAATRTVITVSPSPSVFGEEVLLRAVVTPIAPGAGVPTGFVLMTEPGGVTFLVPLDASGVAEVRTTELAVGSYSGTATYQGDANFLPSTGAGTHTVGRAGTTTTVTTGPDPSVFGQEVTLTATVAPVAPGAGTPTGTVTFTVDGTTTLTAALSGGTASAVISTLHTGPHTITAVYAGDASFTGSTGTDTHQVDQAATTTTVTSDPDPSVFGQPVVLTAAVQPVFPGAGVPTGTVTFTISGGGTFTVPLDSSGTATLSTATLPAGSLTVTAVYSGDPDFTTSTGTDTHTVAPAATTTTVTSSPDPSALGDPVTIRAVVTADPPGSGTPTGTVVFTIDGTPQAPVALDANGTAVLITSSLGLTPDPHTVEAQYLPGTGDFAGSSGSDTHRVEVTPQTTTVVTSAPDPSVFGETVTFTATITPAGAGPVPTGTVTFTVSGGTGGGTFTVPVDASGTATLTLDTLSVADHAVTAAYSGDGTYDPSSGSDTHLVNRASTRVETTSFPDPSVSGQEVTLTATVVPLAPGAGTPTGQITFTIDGTTTLTAPLTGGTATTTISTLAPGPHSITAEYSGDQSFNSSTGTDTHQVDRAGTDTTVTSGPDPSVSGQPVTFTAAVTAQPPGAGVPTGTVTFTFGAGSGTGPVTVPLDPTGTATLTTGALPVGHYLVTATYNGDAAFTPSFGVDTHNVERAATRIDVTSSPDPSAYGQSVVFLATLSPVAPGAGTPGGTVVFEFTGPTTLTLTGTVGANGVAEVDTGELDAGEYTVTAGYSGDSGFLPVTGSDTHTVSRAATQTVLVSTPDPSVYGQEVLFEAVVSAVPPGAGTPTGTVTLVSSRGDSVVLPLDANGVARFTDSTFPAGSYSADAFYSGDANFAPSSGADTHVVDRAATTTSITVTPSPSVFGEEILLRTVVTAVSPGAGIPTGTVVLTEPSGVFFTAELDEFGVAEVRTTELAVGSYSGTSAYLGDANFLPSSGAGTHVVTPADTTTTVTSTPDPTVFGQTVTLTAVVAPVPPGSGTPQGTVNFVIDGSTTLVGTLVGGTATVTTNSLSTGPHTIVATYVGAGDPGFNSSSGTDTHQVNQASTTTTVSSGPDPSYVGQPVVFTAAVTTNTPGSGTPTGTVTFTITGHGTTTVPVDTNGTATLTVNSLPAGAQTATATYNGDTNHTTSTGTTTQQVLAALTTTTVTTSPDPSALGSPVTIRATVTTNPPATGTPTGTVTFTIDGTPQTPIPLDPNGDAVLTTSALGLTPNPHTITADYTPNTPDHTPSTGTDTHTVELAPQTTTTVTSTPDPTVFGQTATFTATVTPNAAGPTPTGTVTFTISGGTGGGTFTQPLDGTGTATLNLTTLSVTEHAVTATYNGDTNYDPSTGADTHLVNPANTTTTVTTGPDPSVFGEPVTLTATVAPVAPGTGTPQGQVTFLIDGTTTLTATLTSGTATTTINTLTPGPHTITATYNGDTGFNASTATDTHQVNPANTTTTVTSNPDPSVYGQPIVFTAQVLPASPGAGIPTGTVTFAISGGGGTFTRTVDETGHATLTVPVLPTGNYTVTATYSGDTGFNTSTGTDTQTVNQATTQMTVTSTPDPSAYGASDLFVAVVQPVSPGGGTPTGTVSFVISGPTTVTLNATLDANGVAEVATALLPAGEYTVTATYSGSGDFTPVTGTDTHTVTRAATQTVITSSPDPSVTGEPVLFEVVVTPISLGVGVPSGTVTVLTSRGDTIPLTLDANGRASFTDASFPAGSYSLDAFYDGDANFAPSSGADTHVVDRAATTTSITVTPSPSVFGEEILLRAVVTPVAPGAGVPTGIVVMSEPSGVLFIAELDEFGVAEVRTTELAVGSYSGTAAYQGDANYLPSAGSGTHVVTPADTTTTVTSTPDPTVFGQTVTLTAVVAPVPPGSGTPQGTVNFVIDGTTTLVGTLVGGTATVTTNSLSTGPHTIVATYVGASDPSFNSSSGTDTHQVNQASTTTTVSSGPDPSYVGQPVVFTAAVTTNTPGSGTPTGTVTFTITGHGTTTVPVDTNGTATLTVNSLPAGAQTATATYNGDTNHTTSTGTTTQQVLAALTTTTVTTSPDPSALGSPVTIRATVTTNPPATGTPTGTVTFTIDGTPQTPIPLDPNGDAVLTTSALGLTPNPHTITADYTPNTPDHTPSTGTDTHTVELAPQTTTTVTSTPDPTVFGQTATFTATVTPNAAGPTPTGTVTFTISGGTGGGTFTQPLDGTGTATLNLTTLSVTEHAVTATYNGDTNYDPSTGADTHLVNPANTTTTVTTGPDPSVFGEPVTLTATVAPVAPGTGTPQGQVTFLIDGTTTLTATLTSGTATTTINTLTPGPHTITATYNGDTGFNASTATDTHQVNPANTTTTVTSNPDPSVYGQPIVFTAQVLPASPGAGIPTGTVTFAISGGGGTFTRTVDETGHATLTVPVLPTGNYTVTATYSGDTGFNTSTGTDTHTVNAADTATSVTGTPNPSFFGEQVTFIAVVQSLLPGSGTPTGDVVFTIGGGGGGSFTVTLDSDGIAQLTLSTLEVGPHTVTADYESDSGNFNDSTGSTTQIVDLSPTTTTVTSAPDPSIFGEPVTLTATVAATVPGAGTPTGTVTFVIDGTTSVTQPLVSGVATFTTSSLAIGPHTVQASYNGDAQFATSSGADTHTVDRAPTTTVSASSPNPSLPGRLVTFTATVTPVPPGTGTPTGTVTFVIDGGGGGTFTAPLIGGVATTTNRGLTLGPHTVTTTYSGDADFQPSTGSHVHTVSN